jgi:hypothetical protein
MRLIFIFPLFLVSFEMMGQIPVNSNNSLSNFQKNQSEVKVRIRCLPTKSIKGNPLLIIDGIPVEFEKLNNLNPDDIESIIILKDSLVSGIISCRQNNGVIIVTTKAFATRKFQIKDILSGNNLPGATLTFVSNNDDPDTLQFAANDNGMITTDKLKLGIDYKVTITSAGYKPLSAEYKKGITAVETFLMERDIQEFAPVVVQSGIGFGCRRTIVCRIGSVSVCLMDVKKISKESIPLRLHSIYPNPVQKGRALMIEVTNAQSALLYVKFFAADGRQLLLQSVTVNKGANKIPIQTDSRWASGVYFVQVMDEMKNPIKTNKIVVE